MMKLAVFMVAVFYATTPAVGALQPNQLELRRPSMQYTALACALTIAYPVVHWYREGPARLLERDRVGRLASELIGMVRVAILCSPALAYPTK